MKYNPGSLVINIGDTLERTSGLRLKRSNAGAYSQSSPVVTSEPHVTVSTTRLRRSPLSNACRSWRSTAARVIFGWSQPGVSDWTPPTPQLTSRIAALEARRMLRVAGCIQRVQGAAKEGCSGWSLKFGSTDADMLRCRPTKSGGRYLLSTRVIRPMPQSSRKSSSMA